MDSSPTYEILTWTHEVDYTFAVKAIVVQTDANKASDQIIGG